MSFLQRTFLTMSLVVSPVVAHAQCTPADLTQILTEAEETRIAQAVEERAYGLGRAFTATRGEERIFLFGTFHSDATRIGFPTLIDAVRDAETLLAEITASDEATLEQAMQVDPSLMFDMTGPGLTQDLTSTELDQMGRALQPLGMNRDVAQQMQPWFAGVLLSLPACEMIRQASGADTMDRKIEELAQISGTAIRGLESPQEALEILADVPRDEQIEMLRASLATIELTEPLFSTSLALYDRGRIAEILELSFVLAERTVDPTLVETYREITEERLIATRNRAWMPVILDASATGPTAVAAGALHLSGEAGLLRLLEAEGFEITRNVLPNEVTQ